MLTISARPIGGKALALVVTNRGEGTARRARPAPAEHGTGVGLANVCARLKARFGDAANCTFGPLEGGGYEVCLTLPFESAGSHA